jgi:hypothetical protein
MSRGPVLVVAAALAAAAVFLTGPAGPAGAADAAVPAGAAVHSARKPSDAQVARSGLLRLSDFPTGWKQSKHADPRPSGIAACKAAETANAKARKYKAQSPDFSQSAASTAQNTVYVFPKESQAIAYLQNYKGTTAGTCLQQRTQKAVKGIPGATTQVQALDLSSALQSGSLDDAVGYGVGIGIPASPPAQLDLVFVATRIGRSVALFSTENQDSVLPETDDLINASLSRLKAALG